MIRGSWRRADFSNDERYQKSFKFGLSIQKRIEDAASDALSQQEEGTNHLQQVELELKQKPMTLDPFSCGSTIWDASIVLSRFLELQHTLPSSSPQRLINLGSRAVLELGSGCGLVSCCSALFGGNVVSTEYNRPMALQLLEENLKLNAPNQCFTVKALSWGNETEIEQLKELGGRLVKTREGSEQQRVFDYIFAADVIYEIELTEKLVETLIALSTPEITTIVVAQQNHNPDAERVFLREMELAFDCETLTPDRLHSIYQADDIWVKVFRKRSN
eukprot:TRINITY_DN7368_c0_g1_i1.p1 TRINITY_DN7368_c0_g1~~TRINITY_DN7368_c0_g1_i1.p1  ORF type:complete len:275 (+),score=47.02 TRINITY_DN7368_c0_g1_i1:104-928(+)